MGNMSRSWPLLQRIAMIAAASTITSAACSEDGDGGSNGNGNEADNSEAFGGNCQIEPPPPVEVTRCYMAQAKPEPLCAAGSAGAAGASGGSGQSGAAQGGSGQGSGGSPGCAPTTQLPCYLDLTLENPPTTPAGDYTVSKTSEPRLVSDPGGEQCCYDLRYTAPAPPCGRPLVVGTRALVAPLTLLAGGW
jgi:hypothetical protein